MKILLSEEIQGGNDGGYSYLRLGNPVLKTALRAKIDGANHLQILFRIVIPSAQAGIASLCILSFIDTWNMVEQPIVFPRDSAKYPLSVFLASVNQTDPGNAFVCGILAVLPVLLLLLFLKDSLISGLRNPRTRKSSFAGEKLFDPSSSPAPPLQKFLTKRTG